MKGSIVLALRDAVKEKYGREKWLEALKKAGFEKEPLLLPSKDVDDEAVFKVVNALVEVLNISLSELIDLFGDYWVNVYVPKIYDIFLERCKDAKEFILRLDEIHSKVVRNIPNARPPRFDYEWEDQNTLIMTYKSSRNLIDFAVGLLKGVGKYYNEDLKIEKIDDKHIRVVF